MQSRPKRACPSFLFETLRALVRATLANAPLNRRAITPRALRVDLNVPHRHVLNPGATSVDSARLSRVHAHTNARGAPPAQAGDLIGAAREAGVDRAPI